MADILTPTLGESVAEATVARWTKKVGDMVRKDEILVELETDKVSLEVASPADGPLLEGAGLVPPLLQRRQLQVHVGENGGDGGLFGGRRERHFLLFDAPAAKAELG